MNEVIRNVEWMHAYFKKVTIFEYLHPTTKEWHSKMINGFFEKEEIEKYFIKSENNRGGGVPPN